MVSGMELSKFVIVQIQHRACYFSKHKINLTWPDRMYRMGLSDSDLMEQIIVIYIYPSVR